jgi:hypothetical protein
LRYLCCIDAPLLAQTLTQATATRSCRSYCITELYPRWPASECRPARHSWPQPRGEACRCTCYKATRPISSGSTAASFCWCDRTSTLPGVAPHATAQALPTPLSPARWVGGTANITSLRRGPDRRVTESAAEEAESALGHSRRFGHRPMISGLPPTTDIVRSAHLVRFVPTDMRETRDYLSLPS